MSTNNVLTGINIFYKKEWISLAGVNQILVYEIYSTFFIASNGRL